MSIHRELPIVSHKLRPLQQPADVSEGHSDVRRVWMTSIAQRCVSFERTWRRKFERYELAAMNLGNPSAKKHQKRNKMVPLFQDFQVW